MSQQQKLSIDQFFQLLLPALFVSRKKKTIKEINLYYTYLLYLQDFVKMIKLLNPVKYKEILFTIATFLSFEKWNENRLLMRIGDRGEKFYLILQGKVDLLIYKERKCVMLDKSYYRYLAFLIGYQEYDVVSRVINANGDIYPLIISDAPYGKITKNVSYGIIPIVITLSDLLKVLNKEEMLMLSEGFKCSYSVVEGEEKLKRTPVSTKEYIDRIKPLEVKDPFKAAQEANQKAIEVVVIEYSYITSLSTGQKFGDRALSDPSAKRTATILTSAQCFFGILNKKSYNASLKEVTDQLHKETLKLILSTYVFKDMSVELLLKKYFNSFVQEKVKKGTVLLLQGEKAESVIITKEGEYEITALVSMKKMSKIITTLFSSIKKPAFEYTDEEYSIAKAVHEMNCEDKKLSNRSEEMKALSKFLRKKEEIHICHFSDQDLIGLGDCYKPNWKVMFTYRAISSEGECFSLKREFYNQMRANDPSIRGLEKDFVTQKRMKTISRLLSLRKAKLKLHFLHHPDYAYFKEYCGKSNRDPLSELFEKTEEPQGQFNKKIFQFHINTDSLRKYPTTYCLSTHRRSEKSSEKLSNKPLNYKKQLTLSKQHTFKGAIRSLLRSRFNDKPISLKVKKIEGNNIIKRIRDVVNSPTTTHLAKTISSIMPILKKRKSNRSRNERETTFRPLSSEKYPNTPNTQIDSLMKTSSFWNFNHLNLKENSTVRSLYQMPIEEPPERQGSQLFNSLQKPKMKKSFSSISILSYTLEKKENYITSSTKDMLKRTREMIFRHKSQVSLVKKTSR